MRPLLLALALTLATLPLGSAATDDDAGSGADAPGEHHEALVLPGLLVFTGAHHAADDRDLYRIVDVPFEAARVRVVPLEGALTACVHDLAAGTIACGPGGADLRAPAWGGEVRVGTYAQTPGTYRVEIEPMPLHEIALVGLELEEAPSPSGDRIVHVSAESLGAWPPRASHTRLTLVALHTDGSARQIGALYSTALDREGVTRFTFPWRTLGELGDVEVVARIDSPDDADAGNNELRLRTHVAREGEGADALNQARAVHAADSTVHVGWRYGEHEYGSFQTVHTGVQSPYIQHHAWVGGFAVCERVLCDVSPGFGVSVR